MFSAHSRACQTVLDTIGNLLADRRQRKQFGFNEMIIGPLDKFPILGRLAPHTVSHARQTQYR
jgi:hypothetical protein